MSTETGFTGASTPNATGGFVYLRNRWYDPQTGRFLTQDPIGLAGGVNLYSYAGNNPVMFTDPFGLCAQSGGDSVEVKVCILDNGKRREVTAKAAVVSDPALIGAVRQAAAGMTFGGARRDAALGNSAVSALQTSVNSWHQVAVIPNTVNGKPVITAAATVWGSGDPALALRADVANLVQSGHLNALVPVPSGQSNVTVCGALGHEGVHMTLGQGAGEGTPTRLQGGFRCR
jgi:RHS repeat-associated protein